MIRLFTALPLSQENKDTIRKHLTEKPNVNWTPIQNLHITLNFIGDVNIYQFRQIKQQLHAVEVSPVQIELTEPGVFQTKNQHVVWMGIKKTDGLHKLQQNIKETLEPFVDSLDSREFKPHLTLARLEKSEEAKLQKLLNSLRDCCKITQATRKFTLYASKSSYSGSIYTPLEEYEVPPTMKSVYSSSSVVNML
jgi:2'-5' RNA ligase